jgi:hypothetical protein
VFDKDVCKDLGLRTELLPISKSVMGVPFDDTLIGEHCAGVDVDTNKASIAGGTKGKRGTSIVAEDVEANGKFSRGANRAAGDSHRRDGFGSDVSFGKGNVAEIFNEEGVSTAAFVGASIRDSSRDYFLQAALPSRRTGEWTEVDDADEKLMTLVKERGQKS